MQYKNFLVAINLFREVFGPPKSTRRSCWSQSFQQGDLPTKNAKVESPRAGIESGGSPVRDLFGAHQKSGNYGGPTNCTNN